MAMHVSEIMDWLKTLNGEQLVGVDEGGLCLRVFGSPEPYCEIGGMPEEEDEANEPDTRFSPRNLAACYPLNTAQILKVNKMIGTTDARFMEMPEGPGEAKVCWIYNTFLREIGTITPAQAFKL